MWSPIRAQPGWVRAQSVGKPSGGDRALSGAQAVAGEGPTVGRPVLGLLVRNSAVGPGSALGACTQALRAPWRQPQFHQGLWTTLAEGVLRMGGDVVSMVPEAAMGWVVGMVEEILGSGGSA